MKSNKKTAHDNSIKKTWTIIIIALVLIAIIGIVIFFLIRKPKVTYEYYINNNNLISFSLFRTQILFVLIP